MSDPFRSGGKGGPKLVTRERAQKAVDRVFSIIEAETPPRNSASLLGAAKLLLDQWRAESGQRQGDLDDLTDAELEAIAHTERKALAQ